jgi:hypothetical protein
MDLLNPLAGGGEEDEFLTFGGGARKGRGKSIPLKDREFDSVSGGDVDDFALGSKRGGRFSESQSDVEIARREGTPSVAGLRSGAIPSTGGFTRDTGCVRRCCRAGAPRIL